MQSRELDAAIVAVRRLLEANGLEPAHAKRLRAVVRELVALRRGGKVAERRVVRIVAMVAEVVCDAIFLANNGKN